MQKIKYFLIVILFFLLGLILINQPSRNLNLENIKYVKIAGQEIKVDLALTKEARAQGLSGRKDLKENEGMLFVFERSGNYLFWMKDMFFSIDIIWLGEDMKVIYIKKDARPELYPEIYGSQEGKPDARFILEVVSGFSDKNNLKVGDGVEFY
ncbi:hypothetical protein A2456_00110 [Candidatus Nomurabacteria bacterium RIFOXYC2_FULL_36_19]|uniref:DUF192 domain-containing protein n=3 Tax=Candidatus Nomuraibacteriota TaxID=1752729 RepID=A0A1F6YTJ4_9BACT|nr:MAG: hypothetical protein UR91_C0001G0011 [Candidatus Nomurabacteria bacterium GW2011_GWC2_35_8]OGJ05709.1 MAG: hypothetical protein A2238_00605 [Candidatus Nomurabacteria bacterium RIFOXYA2_FULL_35_9]OGJ06125.1 MAG: hypothetical protein A2192_01780 [Candidatus Nomurabacteria bacterium RIFOXYA1_FULL_35_17]OGJ09712.1 MAG: hypothetical protein A2456_00110 [Candidatus Nomurabacteria bacterium RIFOXYC2_FULL_36_19]OGJ14568.1 MAG: hypothetical protein A2554_02090 [Candidatus Nomurabacteria bacteri